MSRTYRRNIIDLDKNDKPITKHSPFQEWESLNWGEQHHTDCFSSKNNWKYDEKPWKKSSSAYKKVMQKKRRAKIRNAMNNKRYESIPHLRNENDWNFH